MKKNKFLEDIGLTKYQYGAYKTHKNDPRKKKWKKQRKKYGFDSRECWDLDDRYVEWMYSHLLMYYKETKGIINLDVYITTYNGVDYTKREAIEFMINSFKDYLLTRDDFSADAKIEDNLKTAMHLWAEVFYCMWW